MIKSKTIPVFIIVLFLVLTSFSLVVMGNSSPSNEQLTSNAKLSSPLINSLPVSLENVPAGYKNTVLYDINQTSEWEAQALNPEYLQYGYGPRLLTPPINFTWYYGNSILAYSTGWQDSAYSYFNFSPLYNTNYTGWTDVTCSWENGTLSGDYGYGAVYVSGNPQVGFIPWGLGYPEYGYNVTMNVNETYGLNANMLGGTGNFSYSWYVNGVESSDTSNSFNFTPTSPGKYSVVVSVSDSAYNGLANSTGLFCQGIVPPIEWANNTAEFNVLPTNDSNVVYFSESGLPLNTTWSVTMGGVTEQSSTDYIQFWEPNGTYQYSIGTVVGYIATPSSGVVNVSGPNNYYIEEIGFNLSKGYNVTFTESGLPSGTVWSVYLEGLFNSSTTDEISFEVPNGTYNFSIGEPLGYFSSPPDGAIIVDGRSVNQQILFVTATYNVTFTESGLPTDQAWSVTFNGTSDSSTTSEIMFDAPNGTYVFSIGIVSNYSASPDYGTLTVNGKDVAVDVAFSHVGYVVTFIESGLSLGKSWSIDLNDTVQSSSGDSITFYVQNGTYDYSVGITPGWTPSPDSGNVTVDGQDVTVQISFAITTYRVIFVESGLPIGTKPNVTWTITIQAVLAGKNVNLFEESSTNSISIDLQNGTYPFSAKSAYYSSISTVASVTVDGSDVNVSLIFAPSPVVVLNVTPAGSNVSVLDFNIGIFVNITSNGSLFTGWLQPGYYYLNVTHAGYEPYSNLFYAAVNQSYHFNITLAKEQSSGIFRGTISPGNSTLIANGTAIPSINGSYSSSLIPGRYYVTVFAPAYSPYSTSVVINKNETTWLNISLQKSQSPVRIDGYVTPSNSSVTVDGISAYVNSTGYYEVSVSAGNYTISFYSPGFFAFTENLEVHSNTSMNVSLLAEPSPTSSLSSQSVDVTGFSVSIGNITPSPGIVNITYGSANDGTLAVILPYSAVGNLTVEQLLASRVYVNGTQYRNFTVTVTSNFTVILTVIHLKGDPMLTWIYNPSITFNFIKPKPNPTFPFIYYVIIAVVVFVILFAVAILARSRRKK